MPDAFSASLDHGEAVLRFPYDERLRQLLRAIPGRRWDPIERAWCIPLDPERADALARLFASLTGDLDISETLLRAMARQRAKRRKEECVVDLARPDKDWWLSFATDAAPDLIEPMLEHPDACTVPVLGRSLIPLDDLAVSLIQTLRARTARLRLGENVSRALLAQRGQPVDEDPDHEQRGRPPVHDAQLVRDRRGAHWILLAAEHATLGRALASRAGLRAVDGPGATLALAATEHDAEQLCELLDQLEIASTDPRVKSWLERATSWHGTLEVDGPPDAPVFLLLGDIDRLPRALREIARSAPGGAAVPLTTDSWQLIDRQLDCWISDAAERCIEALQDGRPSPPAVLELSTLDDEPTFVLAPGHEPALLDMFASLTGALPYAPRSGATRRHTELPMIRADPFCVPELDRFLDAHEIWVDPEALEVLQEAREEHARAAGLVALSAATDAPFDVAGLSGELKPFQRAGVSYVLAQRRAFLADEQGLGKTIEALAAIEADGAYPAIVVCPASLKLNWMRELSHWLPQRDARALSGTSPLPTQALTESIADITVINYDIVAARLDELRALRPLALVLDESHYCKNAAARRTQAVQRLSSAIPREGLILALTGTPVMNRPPELIAQLRILGRLGDFGSGAQFSKRFRGPDAHLRLHWHLRARCFVRRLKADVLPQLPPKTRSVVPVALDNEAQYRLAEHDVVAWLQSQPLDLRELDAKVAAAMRAERLVRLNALQLLAARGKLQAALSWIHDFCSSGERLVVFARHREIQRAVLERFPHALHILGEDSHAARDASLRAFQAPDNAENQLIICSLEVAGQGLTLTRSSNVAFLELDWTPAKHDQAEDRCHRIGQQDAVNASYLLAAETIDETIATLLEHKRAVIGAITDGRAETDEGVVEALVRELRATPYRHLRVAA